MLVRVGRGRGGGVVCPSPGAATVGLGVVPRLGVVPDADALLTFPGVAGLAPAAEDAAPEQDEAADGEHGDDEARQDVVAVGRLGEREAEEAVHDAQDHDQAAEPHVRRRQLRRLLRLLVRAVVEEAEEELDNEERDDDEAQDLVRVFERLGLCWRRRVSELQ